MNLMGEQYDRRTTTAAAAASAVIHALLFLLFMLYKIGELTTPAEWIEISLAAAQNMATPPLAAPRPAGSIATEPKAAPAEPLKVNLPQRRMLERERPELPVRGGEKISPDEKLLVPKELPTAEPLETPSELPADENPRLLPEAAQSNIESRDLPPAEQNFGKSLQVPFNIEGEAANRVVLYRVIPEFPEGVRQEAAVRIGFIVLADGRVGSAVLVQKGEATLEKIALDAFRQWRFNALPPTASGRVEQGVITFRFLLK